MGNRQSSSALWKRLSDKLPVKKPVDKDETTDEAAELVKGFGVLCIELISRKTFEELQDLLATDVKNNEKSKFYVGSSNSCKDMYKRLQIHYDRFSHPICGFEPTFFIAPVGRAKKRVCCKESSLLGIGRDKLAHQKRLVSRSSNKCGYVYIVDTGIREKVPKRPRGYTLKRKWEAEKKGTEPKVDGYEERRRWEVDDSKKFEA